MPYQIYKYSKVKFIEVLADFAGTSFNSIDNKNHSDFFDKYLQKIGATTIILENEYIDYDFLTDYVSYYAKCFHNYNRKCVRLHFFSSEIDEELFSRIITNKADPEKKTIQDGYLGFIVVKPLPRTIFGRTCLKTYNDHPARAYPTIRTYEANLFGLPLSVESLAYQEQDSVAAACATSALWSAFHGTGKLFQHTIPSPIEITNSATQNFLAESRCIPNKGLTLEQMAHAVKKLGLEPYKIGVSNFDWLKASASAYMRAGVPIILAFRLCDTFDPSKHEEFGLHATTITGYRVEPSPPAPWQGTNFHIKSSRISKLYVHDDQIGPFARMIFDNLSVSLPNKPAEPSIWTSWKGKGGRGNVGDGRAIPFAVLMPLYNKIRIPFENIFHFIFHFDGIIDLFQLGHNIEWDIFLTQLNTFKTDVHQSSSISDLTKKRVLLENFPKYLWVARAFSNGTPLIDLIFDATDIEQGNNILSTIDYDPNFHQLLTNLFLTPQVYNTLKESPAINILDFFRRQPSP